MTKKAKAVNSRKDAVTKDMPSVDSRLEREYLIAGLGVTVRATSYAEAVKKAKAKFTSKKANK